MSWEKKKRFPWTPNSSQRRGLGWGGESQTKEKVRVQEKRKGGGRYENQRKRIVVLGEWARDGNERSGDWG